MKFSYVIGNPPYQSETYQDNVPIWPGFIDNTVKLADKACYIHPGRWVIPSNKYTKYRDNILNNHLAYFRFYEDSNSVFPSLRGIQGGVTITYFDEDYTNTPLFDVFDSNYSGRYDVHRKIFISRFEEELYDKIWNKFAAVPSMQDRITLRGFGYDKWTMLSKTKKSNIDMKEPIYIYTNDSLKKNTGTYIWCFIEKAELDNVDENIFKSRKILISTVGQSRMKTCLTGVFNKWPMFAPKMSTTQNHYMVFPENDTDRDLQLLQSLFITKTARYLMTITQKGIGVCGFENIPDYTELEKLLPTDQLFTDQWFYNTFKFSENLIKEIESTISEMIPRDSINDFK